MELINLKTNILGKKIFYYESIDSTQKEIWRRIKKQDIENGTIIIADIQTNGVGTHGRIWHTDEERNIAFSIFLEPECEINKLLGLTTRIAEIIVEVFEKLYNVTLDIKLPNDIVYKDKKIGGILTQTKLNVNIVKYLVIGIGINTNQTCFDNEISNIATSIKKVFGIDVDSNKVISEICNIFEKEIIDRIGEN